MKNLLPLFWAACTATPPDGLTAPTDTASPPGTTTDQTTQTACDGGAGYPAGAVEPMALGEVLTPYRWPDAIHRGTGARGPLDLGLVPCAADPDIDWSRFAALLFVSIPAW